MSNCIFPAVTASGRISWGSRAVGAGLQAVRGGVWLAWIAACAEGVPNERTGALEELAATGSLRVAVAIAPAPSTFFSARDEATGELVGVAVTLGESLARDLGVPVTFVEFASSGEITDAADQNVWDVTFMPVDGERARVVQFGPAYNLFESTYLVVEGVGVEEVDSVDRAGMRVGVIANTTTGRAAEARLEAATLVQYGSVDELERALREGQLDAAGMSRASLQGLSASIPGSRILAGAFHSTANAVAVPLGRGDALEYVSRFVERAKSDGLVRAAFDEIGLTDAVVAPAEPGGP
jgi:polar amino acid transport system substrate-binding protein